MKVVSRLFRATALGQTVEAPTLEECRALITALPALFPEGVEVSIVGPSNGDPTREDDFPFTPPMRAR